MKLFRCSSLHNLVGDAKSIAPEFRTEAIDKIIAKKKRTDDEQAIVDHIKNKSLSDVAKSKIREALKEDLYGFKSFTGNKYTAKGNAFEDMAIEMSGKMRFRQYQKHVGRVSNEFITGECDILDQQRRLIIDTKCTWDIGTHPFFADEALEKVKKAGYDWQMQGYMWLYDCDMAHVDFWLFPCPVELTSGFDNREQLIDLVESIDIRERLTTVVIERDESMIQKIKDKIPHCQVYYEKQMAEKVKGSKAA